MPEKGINILNYNPGKSYMKVPFSFVLELSL